MIAQNKDYFYKLIPDLSVILLAETDANAGGSGKGIWYQTRETQGDTEYVMDDAYRALLCSYYPLSFRTAAPQTADSQTFAELDLGNQNGVYVYAIFTHEDVYFHQVIGNKADPTGLDTNTTHYITEVYF